MRRKPDGDKEGCTRLIYKKSNNTICTQSKTCSGVSQLYTRSAILQIKKNLSEATEKYVDGDKVKRDFSIETDICILRRYYKNKRLKMSNQGGSAKSKYSTVIDTELDEVDELQPDSSACGDSENIITDKKTPRVDLASVMIENLKGLVNNWIHKHLLDNKDNKDKIDTVLDSMLHHVDLNIPEKVHSQSTYILQRDQTSYRVKNKKLETTSVMCHHCKHKSRPLIINESKTIIHKGLSSYSVPFSVKKIRLISTLSIPRNMHKIKKINSLHIRRIGRKKIALTIDRSSDLLKSSSFDLLTISTKSFTKRCATYEFKNVCRKASTAFYPEPTHKITKAHTQKVSTSKGEIKIINRDNLEDMPSLFKSIYGEDPENIMRSEQFFNEPVNDIQIMTNNNVSSDKIQKDYQDNPGGTVLGHKVIFKMKSTNENDPMSNRNINSSCFKSLNANVNEYKQNYSTRVKVNKQMIRARRNKCSKRPQIHRIQNKHFYIDYNKINNKQSEEKQLLRNFQNVLKYISNYGSNKNIKLDIHINFPPLRDGIDKCTVVTGDIFPINKFSTDLVTTETNLEHIIDIPEEVKEVLKENGESSEKEVIDIKVMPSLKELSQSKYDTTIFINTSKSTIKNKETMDSNDLVLVKEISELKSVIKDLAVAAEKFVAERNKEDAKFVVKMDNSKNRYSYINSSKAVQYSSNFQTLIQCGIKLSKEPRKDANEYYNRLMKKSNSYNIIESESVLKVTDMTIINELIDHKKKEEGLTCSLPKSRSLFEITGEKKDKVATYYCEKCVPKAEFVYDCEASAYTPRCSTTKTLSQESKCSCTPSKYEKESSPSCVCTDSVTPVKSNSRKSSKCKNSSTIEEKPDKDCSKSPICRNKKGMGFGEGFLYCLLMWIPITIILCLFYGYVLHDKINSGPKLDRLREDGKNLACKENNTIDIKLSDLGF